MPENPEVEAVYIATPPGEHEKYTVLAARAKKHVLCEKPLATPVDACRRMVRACRDNKVLLMTAYRKYLRAGQRGSEENHFEWGTGPRGYHPHRIHGIPS